MKISLKKFMKQTGVAMTEYAVLLAFVAAIGASFFSGNGLSNSITGAVSKAVYALNSNIKFVDKENQPHFGGTGSGKLSGLGSGTFDGNWSWNKIWTNDTDAFSGSAYLEEEGKSGTASKAALQLIEQMREAGSFGSVDPVSWAFTEGFGSGNQSLNLYWSDSDWKNAPNGTQVPIMQMNMEKDGNVKYYVAMANVSDGKLQLWNDAAALKGNVSYVNASNGSMVDLNGGTTKPGNNGAAETSSINISKNHTDLAFTDFNDAQKAYYDLMAKQKQ